MTNKNKMIVRKLLILFSFLFTTVLFAQENLAPLGSNLNYFYPDLKKQVTVKPSDVSHQKTAAVGLSLPFIEDFYYASTSNYPDQTKWSDSLVYVNAGFPTAPPSIGVATFDGLNKHGFPYTPAQLSLTLSLRADTLTSRPINLYTSGTQTLDPDAGVALSFHYQARGKGDLPEPADSLTLDFFRPYAHPDTAWKRVWFSQGFANTNTNDTVFKRVFVQIKDSAYFHDGFKFRFRNWASTTANVDHWHLDYVVLDKGRDSLTFLGDSVRNDITISAIPSSFLRDYSSMPYQQYVATEMASNVSVRIRNNSGTQVNMGYIYKVYDSSGNQVFTDYNGGFENLNPFIKNNFPVPPNGPGFGYSTAPVHAKPAVNFTVPPLPDSTDYKIKHFIFLTSTATDFIKENDTVVQNLRFRNYYSMDDGSAEAGYYLAAPGARMAVKIRVNAFDTLRAVRIYFDPAGLVNLIQGPTSDYLFNLCVWTAAPGGNSPGTLMIQDTINLRPIYYDSIGFKRIPEYKFKSLRTLSPGNYFIGIEQYTRQLRVGFDRNYDTKHNTFYDVGGGWTQSATKGSLMIRPVFGKFIPKPVGIDENSLSDKTPFLVYPNPASEQFIILSSNLENKSYQLYNSMGQLVKEDRLENNAQEISTNTLSAGMYILILKAKGQSVQQQKLIIEH